MLENPIFLLVISTFIAAIPIAVWFYIFLNRKEKNKKIVAIVFLLGCLTAPALLGLQYVWDIFPQFNLSAFIENNIKNQNTMFVFLFVLFGAMEEIIKLYVVRTVDKKTLLINNVNDAIRYSITSALGFSFIENAYYLYQFWPSISMGELAGMFIFRSIFTTCAHMIFSGIFGYFYGIGKFSMYTTEQNKVLGEKDRMGTIISRIFSLPLSEGLKQKMVIKGLLIAVIMHSTFNYLLQFSIMIPVFGFVVLGYLYLKYLLKRKSGHLILIVDPTTKKTTTMAKNDEDVVIELLGMWFKDKRYVDVIHICERLLQRDPDNEVVKLFKAKAMDKMEDNDTYKKILGTVIKSKDDISENDKNILEKYSAIIQKLPQKETPTEKQKPKKKEKDSYVEKFTGDDVFKI